MRENRISQLLGKVKNVEKYEKTTRKSYI